MKIPADIFLEAVPVNEYKKSGQAPLFGVAVGVCLVILFCMFIARVFHIF